MKKVIFANLTQKTYLCAKLISHIPMNNKELYKQWWFTQDRMPVFMQPWWLDAVCAGKQWDVMLWDETGKPITDDTIQADTDNQVIIAAAMPYLFRERMRIRFILMPQQTQIGGIWIRDDKRDDFVLLNKITDNLIQQLENLKLWYYYQQYPLSSPIPTMLAERGMKVKERITYRIDDLSDMDKVMSRFSKNKRRQLQKAMTLTVDKDMDIEDFYRYHQTCLEQSGKKITYTREFLMVLYLKAVRLNQCCIIRINTLDGNTAAAAFVVWDKRTMYYLIPCYSLQYKDSGAGALLVWEALKLAREKGLQFDFEGSMLRGVANHYKQFGSTPNKYYSVHKFYNPLFAIPLFLQKLKTIKPLQ